MEYLIFSCIGFIFFFKWLLIWKVYEIIIFYEKIKPFISKINIIANQNIMQIYDTLGFRFPYNSKKLCLIERIILNFKENWMVRENELAPFKLVLFYFWIYKKIKFFGIQKAKIKNKIKKIWMIMHSLKRKCYYSVFRY